MKEPPTVTPQSGCPKPPHCQIIGHWKTVGSAVKLSVVRAGSKLNVTYEARGQKLRGEARDDLAPKLRVVQVKDINETAAPRCLELVLVCHMKLLWVTELPVSGSFPALTYRLHPVPDEDLLLPSPPPPPPSRGNRTAMASVMVNVTLYSNGTAEDDPGAREPLMPIEDVLSEGSTDSDEYSSMEDEDEEESSLPEESEADA